MSAPGAANRAASARLPLRSPSHCCACSVPVSSTHLRWDGTLLTCAGAVWKLKENRKNTKTYCSVWSFQNNVFPTLSHSLRQKWGITRCRLCLVFYSASTLQGLENSKIWGNYPLHHSWCLYGEFVASIMICKRWLVLSSVPFQIQDDFLGQSSLTRLRQWPVWFRNGLMSVASAHTSSLKRLCRNHFGKKLSTKESILHFLEIVCAIELEAWNIPK